MTHVEHHPFPSGSEPEYELATPLGTPTIRALAHDAIGVSGGIPHNVDGSERSALTINGVSYSVQAHFRLWSDGKWHAGAEDSRENWREPHLSRRQYNAGRGYSGNEPTRAAIDKARDVLAPAVTAWAESHTDALDSAEDRRRKEAAHSLAKQLDEHEQACEVLRDHLARAASGEPYCQYPLSN